MESTTTPALEARPERLLGVWVLTIYLGLMAGLVPLVAAAALYASGHADFVAGPIGLAFTCALALGVIISAVGAWRGSALAHDVLVVLSVLHYAIIAFNNVGLALGGMMPDDQIALTWARAVRSLVHAGIVVWYFRLSRRADGFYERRSA